MSDGGWTLGLLTLLAIFGGAALYASVALRYIFKPVEKPSNKTDFRAILAKQATEAERRALVHSDIPTWDEWLHCAAMRLLHWWPSVSYDDARKMIREFTEDIGTYPDPSLDWSMSAAEEVADEYMREYGETHGVNV